MASSDGSVNPLLLVLAGTLAAALVVAVLFLAGVFAADPGPTITYFRAQNGDANTDSIDSGVERRRSRALDAGRRRQLGGPTAFKALVRRAAELNESHQK